MKYLIVIEENTLATLTPVAENGFSFPRMGEFIVIASKCYCVERITHDYDKETGYIHVDFVSELS